MYTYETIDEQVTYLTGLGYVGALADMIIEYYNDEALVIDDTLDIYTSLSDTQYRLLILLGYVGTTPDMLFKNQSYFNL